MSEAITSPTRNAQPRGPECHQIQPKAAPDLRVTLAPAAQAHSTVVESVSATTASFSTFRSRGQAKSWRSGKDITRLENSPINPTPPGDSGASLFSAPSELFDVGSQIPAGQSRHSLYRQHCRI